MGKRNITDIHRGGTILFFIIERCQPHFYFTFKSLSIPFPLIHTGSIQLYVNRHAVNYVFIKYLSLSNFLPMITKMAKNKEAGILESPSVRKGSVYVLDDGKALIGFDVGN